MSRNVPAGMVTELGSNGATTLATCWEITLKNGTVLRFTDHDRDIPFGGNTYDAETGYSRTAIQDTSDLTVDNLDVVGVLDVGGVTEGALRAGDFKGATFEIFVVNWKNPDGDGKMTLRTGELGELTTDGVRHTAELRGLMDRLQHPSGKLYSPDCRAQLGDSDCGVRLDPPEWTATTAVTVREDRDAKTGDVVKPTSFNRRHFKCVTAGTTGGSEPTWDTTIGNTTNDGTAVWEAIQALTVEGTVTGVTDNRVFQDTSLVEADGLFTEGLLTWVTGNNAGLSMMVKKHELTGTQITLFLSMRNEVQVGDTYTLSVGCPKTRTACKDLFDNILNFRGEPDLPGNDAVFQYET